MDRPGHESVRFFVGTEVEHTPVYGHRTLFVVGVQPVTDILHWAEHQECDHIYFGANQSFPNPANDDFTTWNLWELMIQPLLVKGHWCTLDVDVRCVPGLTDSMLVEYSRFIPMISVKMPHVRQLGYNAVLKIDDVDFEATNPGVWCHSLHNLQTRAQFTDWSQYTKDATIQ